jgi:hypothetical protein
VGASQCDQDTFDQGKPESHTLADELSEVVNLIFEEPAIRHYTYSMTKIKDMNMQTLVELTSTSTPSKER